MELFSKAYNAIKKKNKTKKIRMKRLKTWIDFMGDTKALKLKKPLLFGFWKYK
jgi:hypothetical protein